MAHEEKFCENDILLERIEGKTKDKEPAYAKTFIQGQCDSDSVCLLVSGSYNYARTSDVQYTPQWAKGAYFILDVGGHPASGTLQWFLDIMNPCNGEFSAIAQGTSIPGSGTTNTPFKYLIYPGAVDTGSLLTSVTQLPLPYQWRCRVLTGEGSGTWSYSLGVQYVD
jgi:hypothetical protein